MHLGTEYRAVWSMNHELDEHSQSRVAAEYFYRVDQAAEQLGIARQADALAEVHDRYGIDDEWNDIAAIEDNPYEEVVLDDFDIRYTLENGGFIHFEYDQEAEGCDFRLRASGGSDVRNRIEWGLERQLETTLTGSIRELLE